MYSIRSKTRFEDLPETLPIFPLAEVLLLPRGLLPLNIFEDRYLAMVDAALATDRLVGMIQPQEGEGTALKKVGCAGRITAFEETKDGRYLITLTGICRFQVRDELSAQSGFRRIVPDFSPYMRDLLPSGCLDLDRPRLTALLRSYFDRQGLSCSWEKIKESPDETLMTALAMICPLPPADQQTLLEAEDCKTRARLFIALMEREAIAPTKGTDSCCH